MSAGPGGASSDGPSSDEQQLAEAREEIERLRARVRRFRDGVGGPDGGLDYIFVNRGGSVKASGRALHTAEWVASDHYAVWADLAWE